MHEKFLHILHCPKSRQNLILSVENRSASGLIESGTLTSQDGRFSYPIIKGIPRFVQDQQYTDTFGFEWKKWSRVQFEDENQHGPMQGHTRKMFYACTELNPQEIQHKTVAEFGCGPGRFLDFVRKGGGIAVGIDMSLAVESARENFKDDSNLLIIQGDIIHPPFREEIFDAAYSIGVIHHIPDPFAGLQAMHRTVKKNGKIAVCVYSNDLRSIYAAESLCMLRAFYRFLKQRIHERAAHHFAMGYSYFSAYGLYYVFKPFLLIPGIRYIPLAIAKYLLLFLNLPDTRWRILDMFDAITSHYASTHTAAEVEGWLSHLNCTKIKQTPWGPTSYTAIK